MLFGFLGFHPDKTHRDSLLAHLRAQLIQVQPDSAEARLLERSKQNLVPFPGIVPPFQPQVRWITAKQKKYSTKTYAIVSASHHADFLRSFIVRSFHEKRILGLRKVCSIGGWNTEHLPAAIDWNNKFLDESSILSLLNISKKAMDQPFQRQATVTSSKTTTLCRILLLEGKATIIYESRDVALGRWIGALTKDKVELFTKIVAGTITKLFENGQIVAPNFLERQLTPSITNRPTCRNSGTSAMSNDDTSIQSLHSNKAWSEMTTDDGTGSISKKISNQSSRTLQFIFEPSSTEFPPLSDEHNNVAQKTPADATSIGSASTVTKTEFEQFQTKLSKDLAANLKECRSLASSVTDNGSRQSFIEELRAERAQSDARVEKMIKANQQMMLSMQQMFQNFTPNNFQQHQPPQFPPQQQFQPLPQAQHPSQHALLPSSQQQQLPTQSQEPFSNPAQEEAAAMQEHFNRLKSKPYR